MAYTNDLVPVLTSNTSDGAASASTEYSFIIVYAAWNAFDDDTSKYWRTTTAGVAPCWLKYRFKNFATAPAVTQYTIKCNLSGDAPNDWTFEGSNNDSTWTTLDTQTDITWSDGEKKTFSFSNTTKYLFYRINISANNGATYTAIVEMEMMATIANDIQVATENLQVDVEFQDSDIQVARISVQAEVGIPDIQVAGVSIQVELDVSEEPPAIDYRVWSGQYIKIYLNSVLRFAGIINEAQTKKADNGSNTIFQEISCVGLNSVPTRRTIKVNQADGTTVSEIVTDVITSILSQEGIEAGRIDDGSGNVGAGAGAIKLNNDWVDDCISVSDLLDECANLCGFQWYIDKDFKLQFLQDPTISTSTNNIIDGGSFTDFRDVVINETIDNYYNKVFVVGGDDDHGDPIFVVQGNLTQQNQQQLIAAGSGVYGMVHRDSALTQHDYITASVDTSATTIAYGGHPFSTGDYFWNVTRDAYSIITDGTSDPDYAECESVASQASGDTIEVYVWPNQVGRNIIKKQSLLPSIVDFKSFTTEFEPGDKIQISLSDVSISGYFSIDDISIREVEACIFETQVKCIYRDSSDFSTQKNEGYIEYFRGF